MDSRERYAGCTDNELMRLTAGGEKTAYEVLVLRYRREAELYCMSLIQNESEAEDIVQDCFVEIYVQRQRYCSHFSFRTYLYAVLRHKVGDWRRKSARAGTLEPPDSPLLENTGPAEPSVEEQYLAREEQDRLARWILELPEAQREALYLFCVDGCSYQEIAGRMNKSVAQVKIWIYRARKNLRKRRMEW